MLDFIDIDKVKSVSSIVDVARDFVELKPDGSGFTCLCPFHADRHLGSFKISPQRNIYKCFACGETGNPVDFVMKMANLNFVEAIRWLAAKYSIPVAGSEAYKVRKCQPRQVPPPLPYLSLPDDMVRRREDVSCDTLYKWMISLPWEEEDRQRIDETWRTYRVGHGKDGHTIFWQIDEDGVVRTGKMMLYKPDGHRDKEARNSFSFIHSKLLKAGYYSDLEKAVKITYFGMHLLNRKPHALIHIVESEKTALLCAIGSSNSDDNVWMATGGMHFLTPEKLKPIIQQGRYIVLHPDRDAVEAWKKVCRDIGYEKMTVDTYYLDRYWQESDGEKADIADIMTRLMQERSSQRSAAVSEPTGSPFDIIKERLNLREHE